MPGARDEPFTLRGGGWYAWEMFPGYGETPFRSPIRVRGVMPLGTGHGLLRLQFRCAAYAEGVQEFCIDLRVLKRTARFLFAEAPDHPDRGYVLFTLEPGWLRDAFPAWCSAHRIDLSKPLDRRQLNRALGEADRVG